MTATPLAAGPAEAPAQAVAAEAIWGWLPRHWALAIGAWLATRVPLTIFAWLIEHYTPVRKRAGHFLFHGGEAHPHWLVDAFQKWDAYWFLNIVREGYQYFGAIEQISGVRAGQPETNVTPFPLYPMAIRGVGAIVGDPSVAGLLVSQLCVIAAMALLYKLVRVDGSRRAAEWAVWLFAANPMLYAYSAIYSESLFFLLTIASVLSLRRGHYALAGLAGGLSALARLPGVFVIIPLVIDHFRGQNRKSWRVLWLALVPAGTLGYFVYLYFLTGEPLAYFVAQEGWHKEFVGPLYHPLQWLKANELDEQAVLDLVTTVIVTATLIVGYRRIRASDWLFAVWSFLMLLSSSYLLGLPRYASAIYPLFFIWAGLSERHPSWGRWLLAAFAMMAPVAFWVWTTWKYAF